MRTFSTALLITAWALGFCVAPLGAQEIDATVTINDTQLSIAARSEVTDFAHEMERYLESTRWTDAEWSGEKVKLTFNVVFGGVNPDGVYSAKLLVGSQRSVNKWQNLSPMMKVFDEAWVFGYVRNQPFVQDLTRYDDLTGLIDFYVYMALGLDFDSYAPQAGATMYERAWQIAQRAQLRQGEGWTTSGSPGSYTRYNFVKEMMDIRFAPIRKYIYDYHYNGLDLLVDGKRSALDSINTHLSDLVIAIDRLVQPSTIVRVLNDAKNVEYSELFVGYDDPEGRVWNKLLYIDPTHKAIYDAARSK